MNPPPDEQQWNDLKELFNKKEWTQAFGDQARIALRGLLSSPSGRSRILLVMDRNEGFPGKMVFLRELGRVFAGEGVERPDLAGQERQKLLEAATRFAKPQANQHPEFWTFLWLRATSGELPACREIADAFGKILKGKGSDSLAALLAELGGWKSVSPERRLKLLEYGLKGASESGLRAQIQRAQESAQNPPSQLSRDTGNPRVLVPVSQEKPSSPEALPKDQPLAPVVTPEKVELPDPQRTEPGPGSTAPHPRKSERVPRPRRRRPPSVAEPTDLAAAAAPLLAVLQGVADKVDALHRRGMDGAGEAGIESQRLREQVGQLQAEVGRLKAAAEENRLELEVAEERIREGRRDLEAAKAELAAARAGVAEEARRAEQAERRSAAAELRAEQTAHEAEGKSEADVAAFRARLWDALQGMFADITNPAAEPPGGGDTARMLWARLHKLKDRLKGLGIPPG